MILLVFPAVGLVQGGNGFEWQQPCTTISGFGGERCSGEELRCFGFSALR